MESQCREPSHCKSSAPRSRPICLGDTLQDEKDRRRGEKDVLFSSVPKTNFLQEMRKQQEHKLSIAELGNATQSQNFLARDVDEIMEDA